MGKANKGPRSANALFCASSWLNLKTASILALILIACCFVGCAGTASSTPNPFVRESTAKIQNFDEFAKTKLDRKIKEVFDLKELGLPPPHENFESFRRRNLLGSTSASASTVTGTGVVNNNALTSQTVTVVAKDSSGNNRNTGGDLFYIKVDNKSTCTSAFSCSLVAGAPTTITTPIFTLMTDLGNGNYTYSYTVNINGYLTVSVLLYNRGYIRAQVYGTYDLSGSVVVDTYVSNINFNWGDGNVLGSGYADYCSVRFTSYLRPPSSTTYSFHVDSDDGSSVYIGSTYYVGGKGTQCICSYDFSAALTGNTDYYFMIEFGEYGGGALVDMLWSYSGQSQVVVPSSYFYYPEQVGSTPYQVTVSCPPGYSGTQPSSPTMCITVCGDGLKAGTEKCDDANTNNGDGCNSSCTSVESSWVCSGGSTTARDTCAYCSSGWYQNDATTPTTCVTHCGDGKRAGTEKCDDANTNNGDGCNSLCTSVESSWVCSGGSTTARDTCTFCTAGLYQNDATTPTTCVTHCGDGLKAGSEKCDDANTNNGDGCNSLCTSVESSWVCSGGSTTARDTCTFCTAGLYQNDATTPTTCVTHCGDGLKAGSEKCDDANTNNGDGCNSLCTSVESSWVCSGGSTTARDTCTFCTAGLYQNDATTPTTCVTHCGDGLRAGSEKCDDANTASGDGCNSLCTSVESSWVCSGGSTTTRDTCTYCSSGWYQNDATTPTTCVTHCGDGLKAGSEKCDDANTNNGDGCNSSCTSVESSWVCSGGSTTARDTCTYCSSGWYQNDATTPTTCVTHCGDGKRAGTEKCDDGNIINGDGCLYDCSAVQSGWVCSGGTTTTIDSCTECMPGYYQNNALTPTSCVTICGDGFEAGTEKCDDSNTASGDGCNSSCTSVEAGWVCSGGSVISRDTCTQCAAGYYQDNSLNPQTCVTNCGDSKRVGSEKCDDGNTNNSDGCKSDCSSVESGWVCSGGSSSSRDTCTQCTSGLYQNDSNNPTSCVPHCGDGLKAGSEKCDDGNTSNGDGCNSTCTGVETSWVCTGGSPTAKDVCSFCSSGWYQNDATTPTTCVTHCGDGFEAGTEKCDDANTNNGDGCKSDCSSVETGWVCIGGSTTSRDTCTFCTAGFYQNSASNPETCVPHCSDGLRVGTEKCDDNNTNNSDGCKSDCSGVESGWVCSGGSSTSKDTCTFCTSGWYQNNPTTPTVCVTHCGDGLEAGTEKCDDNNTNNGDGCKSDCSSVDSGWVCKGGSTTSKDVCQKCSAGFIPDSSTNPENCITVCGDGKRAGNELCDDGNTSNGDGCSSDCLKIEYDWACNGGDVNNKDICQKCHLCYEASNNQRDCIPSDIPYRIKQFTSVYLAVLCIGMIFNLLSTKMYGCSNISFFGVFYQIQMFILIPMIGADVSSDSIYFFEYVKDLLVSFYLLPNNIIFFGHGNIFSSLNYSQGNWYLNLIGLSSGSSLYNMNNYICICCYISTIAILIIPAYSCTKSQEPNSNRHKASKKAFDFIMSQFIFRFILLSYQFLLILSMSEVMNFRRISDGIVSYIFSCSVLSLCIGMLVLSLIKFVSVRKEENFENLFYTKELFNGVKKRWLARTYSSMWMFRRVLFTAVFIAFSNLEFFYKLIASLMIQCLYLIYLCAVRPFESIKDTIGEISNEVFVLLGLFSMCYFNTESKWSSNATQAYLGMLLLSNVVFTTLAIGGFVAQTIKRRLEIREQNARTTRVEDISHIKDITRDNILNLSSIYQLHRRGIPEEVKKADQTRDTLDQSKQLNLSKDALITQTWRVKKNSSDSMINQIAQRELDKMPANIRKIFNNQ